MNALILPATLLAVLAQQPAADDDRSASPPAKPAAVGVSPDWKPLGDAIWFDAKSKPKRLILESRVVLRDGALEHLLCLKGTKEHEAIVATPADPKQIHAGLLLTGAEPGHPVRFQPQFEPPAGSPIEVKVRWKIDGEVHEVDAPLELVSYTTHPGQNLTLQLVATTVAYGHPQFGGTLDVASVRVELPVATGVTTS